MAVPVVRVRQVRVVVHERRVAVRVGVWLGHRSLVRVGVVRVVDVGVVVLQRQVRVAVAVAGAEEQGRPRGHQAPGAELRRAEPLPQDRDGGQRADEGRRRGW